MNPAIILPVLSVVIILNFIIGIVILSRGLKNKVNLLFGLISLGVALWAFGILGFYIIKIPLDYLWIMETHFSAAFIAVIFLLFTFNFPTRLIKKTYIRISPLLPFFIILFYLFFTKSIIGGVDGITYEISSGYIFYAIFIILCFSVGYYALFLQYKRSSDDIQRLQVKYVLAGSILSSLLATISDLILPYFSIFEYNWLGPIFTFFLVAAIAYAILKHHLFNIKVIATELFAFAIWIVLLVKIFFSVSTQDLIVNISLLLVVVFLGIMVIRGVIREVQQREKIEELAKRLEKALGVEKRANEELEKLDKYKNDFLRQTQHDLRSPLSVLMGYTDLMIGGSYGKIPKKAKDILEKMQDVVQAKIKDVNNFLDVEQFKMGKAVVNLTPGVELMPVLEDITTTLSSKALSKGIDLKLKKISDKILVSADVEKLKAALYNIVDNAVKYTERGEVNVAATKNSEHTALIEIKDTGIGMPQDKVKSIFEEQFERTEKAKKTAKGSGVGLYLSGQIIKMHKGKAWAESNGEGKGSAFYVELPLGGE